MHGLTITRHPVYPKLVQIVTAILQGVDIGGTVMTTSDPDKAEAFVQEKLALLAAMGARTGRV